VRLLTIKNPFCGYTAAGVFGHVCFHWQAFKFLMFLSKSVSKAHLILINKSFILSCQQEKLERRIAFSYSLQYDNSI